MPSRPHHPFQEATASSERGCAVVTAGLLLHWLRQAAANAAVRSQRSWNGWPRASEKARIFKDTDTLTREESGLSVGCEGERRHCRRSGSVPCGHQVPPARLALLSEGISLPALAANAADLARRSQPTSLGGDLRTMSSLIFGQVRARLRGCGLQWPRKGASGLLSTS